MFAYNPRVTDRSGEIIASGITGAADVNAKSMETLGNNISSALTSIASSYAENKGLEAQASGYDKVGEILGSSMFAGNNQVGMLLGDLRKEKDAKKKIYGYQALFDMTGAISNSQNSQARLAYQQQAPAQRVMTQNQAAVASQGGPTQTAFPANINQSVIP